MDDCLAPICCPGGDTSEPKALPMPEGEDDQPLDSASYTGSASLLPILIIPGFMSSGLEVQESKLRSDWVGKRIWLNLSSLGMSAFYFGNAQQAEKAIEENEEEKMKEQKKYKSAWLEHMRLNSTDLKTEPKGVKIRAIQGLEGVDYLTPGMFTNQVSYVFGPVIKALQKAGYVEGENLDAAPYDWRLPPSQLENRDKYFTTTISKVEELYKKNDRTPVVLLGHSLGCKTAHYFLNFCLKKKGQKWLDKHIHTYLPVGAPHLGAPKALRSYVAGDKMSLDTFLNDEEALVLGRSFGSGPWLFPQDLPKGVPASAYVMPHGVLQITCEYAINTFDLVHKRRDNSRPNRYKLVVAFGGENRKVSTPFQPISSEDTVFFHDKISFATDATPNSPGERVLQFILQEPGIAAAKHEKTKRSCNPILCCIKCITCLWICDLIYKLIRLLTCGIFQTVILSWDAITASVGGGTTLAFSEPVIVPKGVWKGEEVQIEVKIYHKDDYGKRDGFWCLARMRQARHASLRIKMKWLSYDKQKSFRPICSPISNPDPDGEPLKIVRGPKQYQEFPGYDILEREGLDHTLRMVKDVLDADSLGPRTTSSADTPPVKRVHAIYGVNLPTEIGGIYQRKDTCLSDSELKNLYVLDKKATVDKGTGYIVKGGLLMETTHTTQEVASDRAVCGDGTVPYWSLQHCKTWHSPTCEVSVVELPKAEHREILADARFHQELIKYCTRN